MSANAGVAPPAPLRTLERRCTGAVGPVAQSQETSRALLQVQIPLLSVAEEEHEESAMTPDFFTRTANMLSLSASCTQ